MLFPFVCSKKENLFTSITRSVVRMIFYILSAIICKYCSPPSWDNAALDDASSKEGS